MAWSRIEAPISKLQEHSDGSRSATGNVLASTVTATSLDLSSPEKLSSHPNNPSPALSTAALGIPSLPAALDGLYGIADLFSDFPDDNVCLEHIKEKLWPNGLAQCMKCGVARKHYRVTGRKAYACNHCGHHIYPLAGTIFSKSTTPLTTWFYMLYLMLSTQGTLSARQIQRETGVTYKTAWRSRGQILALLRPDGARTVDATPAGNGALPPGNGHA
jgi:transposase-like protein